MPFKINVWLCSGSRITLIALEGMKERKKEKERKRGLIIIIIIIVEILVVLHSEDSLLVETLSLLTSSPLAVLVFFLSSLCLSHSLFLSCSLISSLSSPLSLTLSPSFISYLSRPAGLFNQMIISSGLYSFNEVASGYSSGASAINRLGCNKRTLINIIIIIIIIVNLSLLIDYYSN